MIIEVSALEIYCEHIRDLLYNSSLQKNDQGKQRYIDVKTIGNKVQAIGQTWIRVDSPEQFLQQIYISSQRRVFKNNGINPHSSRSHHIFQIRINSFDKLGKPQKSLLNIVDLAGSERSQTSLLDQETSQSRKILASPSSTG